MKKIRYLFESILLYLLFYIFKMMPPKQASSLGGWIGKTIGPTLSASRKTRRHIEYALPNKNEEQQNEIIKGMWENLGRIIAEYPHLKKISQNHTEIIYKGDTQNLMKQEIPIVFFGGHIGNWEINCASALTQAQHPITLTYRAPNNPWTARLLYKARTLNGRMTAYPKARESGRELIKTLRQKGSIGILIDQKYNEGIAVPFFEHDAMTNPVFVQLCQKFKCPLIPVRNERMDGCNFRLTIYDPIETIDDDGAPKDIKNVITEAHTLLEDWIKERPEQWIWLHRRWKDMNN